MFCLHGSLPRPLILIITTDLSSVTRTLDGALDGALVSFVMILSYLHKMPILRECFGYGSVQYV